MATKEEREAAAAAAAAAGPLGGLLWTPPDDEGTRGPPRSPRRRLRARSAAAEAMDGPKLQRLNVTAEASPISAEEPVTPCLQKKRKKKHGKELSTPRKRNKTASTALSFPTPAVLLDTETFVPQPRGRPRKGKVWHPTKGCWVENGTPVPKPPAKIRRPRGRPPKGTVWNEAKGLYVLQDPTESTLPEAAKSRSRQARRSQEPLPPGWCEALDETTDKKYYYHEEVLISQWERPTV
mmetsp:Transcript_19744/g.57640  ORF Transcript_19744/g.57640 Transcript_19744/m.57640 type:complete len:237 (-) Transcript_19744:689-1399(-)